MCLRSRTAVLLLLLASATLLLVLVALAGAASAGHRDYMGDWVISGGTTTVSGDTIDVRGNVNVLAGGSLRLENCTLYINWSADGAKGLDVRAGGHFEAYDTTVEGLIGRATVRFSDDARLERCTIRHFYGSMSAIYGITLDGGDIVIRDSVIMDGNYYGLNVKTDTTLANVTTSGLEYPAVYISNYQNAADITVSIADCHFTGTSGSGWYRYGIYTWTYDWGTYKQVDLTVSRTTVQGYQAGLYMSNGGKMDAIVEDCRFFGNTEGASINQSGGSIILRGNVFGHKPGGSNSGLIISAAAERQLTMVNNLAENVGRGYVFVAPWSGTRTVSWDHLTVANCTEGIVARAQWSYTIALTVHNSTVKNCTTNFVAEDGATITIWDTVHVKGSGRVSGTGSWIRAYTPVDIGSVKWKGGEPITRGWLVLENVTGAEVARFDLASLRPQNVAGWEVDERGRRTYLSLWPAIYSGGHAFRGEKIDIWTPGRVIVEIVDDMKPEVTVLEPIAGQGYNVTQLAATGGYTELGSGLVVLKRSLDGGAFMDLTSFHDGTWTLPIVGLPDGWHNLTLRGVDAVGNLGNLTSVEFLVDTVRPFIESPAPETLVNTESVHIGGTVEPGSALVVAGRGAPVAPDGTFSVDVPLVEGPNTIVISVVDRAGNTNSTSFSVLRDTIAPVLKLTAPENATWTNERAVYVDGLTEVGAELRVNGEQAQELSGEFHFRQAVTPGAFAIRVSSTDAAGNRAERALVVLVDWTAPSLTIAQPEGGYLMTRERSYYVSGDVDDATVDHVTVNGQSVPLTSGRFMREYTLVEGTNTYSVSVRDLAGNVNSTEVVIVRDLTPPSYTVELIPIGGDLVTVGGQTYSTATAVEAHVICDEPAIIEVRGRDPSAPTKEARIRFDLKEGTNDISLEIKDQAENLAPSYSRRITVDTTPPPILLFEPTSGARTKETSVVLHGRTDAGCNVTVDDSRVTLLAGGEFRLVIALEDGRNDISIRSTDQMGNTNTTVVSVVKEGQVTFREQGNPMLVGSGGFIAGMVVGVVVAWVALSRRGGRRDEAIAREAAFARPPEARPAARPAEREEGPPGGGPGTPGWEEY